MIAWIALGAALFAAGGLAAGLYLACRYEWPRKLYGALFAAHR